MALLPVDEALRRILDGAVPLEAESVDLLAAAERVLAEDVAAQLTHPPFAASAMDGYAVRAPDVATVPATLRVVGELNAGGPFAGSVAAGEAIRIFTGASVPDGADTVVIQENTERSGESIIVRESAPPGANIRRAGSDFHSGGVLLRAGRLLDASAITLAAAGGHGRLNVRRAPRVAILATGDELVEPGNQPGPGQIISSNPYGLAALLSRFGARPRLLGIAGDTIEALTAELAEAADVDILVTIGGASVGDRDLVKPALEARGMALDFWKVAVRPGKPMLFGRLGATRVVGLPGNPLSCLIAARIFIVPLVFRLLGRTDAPLRSRPPCSPPTSSPTARAATTCAARWKAVPMGCRALRRSRCRTARTCRPWPAPTCSSSAHPTLRPHGLARWCVFSPSTSETAGNTTPLAERHRNG